LNTSRPQGDPRRAGARILDTAEGVLVGLRRYSLQQAFAEIVRTAKRHQVSPLSLADALVAIAQNHATFELDQKAVEAARNSWGHLLYRFTGAQIDPITNDGHRVDSPRSGHDASQSAGQ
jgi:hypothetical protein